METKDKSNFCVEKYRSSVQFSYIYRFLYSFRSVASGLGRSVW